MVNKFIAVVLIFFSISLHSQNIKILKDSVLVYSGFLIIEELKINPDVEKINNKVYAITQNTYEIFDKSFVGKPEDRIRMKKDTLSKRILNNTLRESNSGFEHYEIYYDKNKIVSLSIGIQSYGSPWEAIQYYCFDLNNGKRVGIDLFVDKPGLLGKIRKKLKDQDINLPFKPNDLLNFKIIIEKGKSVPGFYFSVFDTKNYRNSGYEEFSVHFEWKEIERYIVPVFKKRLLTK